ncbi:hypothetical protein QBA75_34770, partial [Streptomyces stelliscabiei]
MNLTLWIAAGLLTAIALGGGISKTFIPRATRATQHGGPMDARRRHRRGTGCHGGEVSQRLTAGFAFSTTMT